MYEGNFHGKKHGFHLICLLKAMGEWCGKPTEKSTSASFLKIKETAILSGRMERSKKRFTRNSRLSEQFLERFFFFLRKSIQSKWKITIFFFF